MGGLESRFDFPYDDTLRENCGIVGVLDPTPGAGRLGVAQLAHTALAGLQHRGEGGAGIVNSSDDSPVAGFTGIKGLGLVNEVFPRGGADVDGMTNNTAAMSIGHTRWATSGGGGDPFHEAQPFVPGRVAVAHNGNMHTMQRLATAYNVTDTITDTHAFAETLEMLSGPEGLGDYDAALDELLPQIDGGFSFVIGTGGALYGVRDPWGTRPLWYGRFASGAHMFASERPVLHESGKVAEERELGPGDVMRIARDGEVRLTQIKREVTQLGRCALEAAYLARLDSTLDGTDVYDSRWEMGLRLAREQPVDADIVIGVPESGTTAAIAYAQELGIPYRTGLSRNPYITRTFIQESPDVRRLMIIRKQRPIPKVLKGMRVVVVDDSIVRGGTTETLAEVLYGAGATEVHYRISAAPFMYPCFSGTAISRAETLFARRYPTDAQRLKATGANSLGYLSVEGVAESQGATVGSVCVGCMTGSYPFQVPTSSPQGRQLLPLMPRSTV